MRTATDFSIGDQTLRDIDYIADRVRTRSCRLFVGAGVPTEIGLPSFRALACDLIDELAKEPRWASLSCLVLPDASLSSAVTPEQIAEFFESNRSPTDLQAFLRERLRVSDAPVTPTYTHLRNLAGKRVGGGSGKSMLDRIYTSNFDDSIRLACGLGNAAFVADETEWGKTISYPVEIIHVFGHVDRGNCIVTESGMIRRTSALGPEALLKELRADLADKTVLFIGYSLRDIPLKLLMAESEILTREKGLRHFAVAPSVTLDADAERARSM